MTKDLVWEMSLLVKSTEVWLNDNIKDDINQWVNRSNAGADVTVCDTSTNRIIHNNMISGFSKCLQYLNEAAEVLFLGDLNCIFFPPEAKNKTLLNFNEKIPPCISFYQLNHNSHLICIFEMDKPVLYQMILKVNGGGSAEMFLFIKCAVLFWVNITLYLWLCEPSNL